jgi:hypothetical protein
MSARCETGPLRISPAILPAAEDGSPHQTRLKTINRGHHLVVQTRADFCCPNVTQGAHRRPCPLVNRPGAPMMHMQQSSQASDVQPVLMDAKGD